MTPIVVTTIRTDGGSTNVALTRSYLDGLIDKFPTLLPYRYAIIDVMAARSDSRIEIYEESPGEAGWRMLFMPDARRAAVSGDEGRTWQWTRASNANDALRRSRDDRMQP
jgi:hypothetical protein